MKEKTKELKFIALTIILMLTILMLNNKALASITEETDTGTITVSGLEAGVTATAYQLSTVNYDYTADQPLDTPYEWVDGMKTWLEGQTETGYSNYLDIEKFSAEKVNEEQAKEFYSKLASEIETITFKAEEKIELPALSGTQNYPVNEDNLKSQAIFEDCEMGTYLILITNGYRVYTPIVVNLNPEYNEETEEWELKDYEVQNIKAKSTNPQIIKTITNAEGTTNNDVNYSTKDTIYFKIEADVPQYLNNSKSDSYYISDDMMNGLNLVSGSIEVQGQKIENDAIETISSSAYTEGTTRPNQSSADFVLNFDYEQIKQYKKIIITYSAKLELGANTVIGKEGNINKAYLDYSNNPYEADSNKTQETSEIKVYTYGAEMTKIDKETKETLTGAIFELYIGENDKQYFVKSGDIYYLANSTDPGAVTNLEVDGEGLLKIYGLDTGIDYKLKEIQAPENYYRARDLKDIDITGTEETGKLVFNFENSKKFQLPVTGGIGTIAFVAGGVVFIGLGIMLYVVTSRKNRK